MVWLPALVHLPGTSSQKPSAAELKPTSPHPAPAHSPVLGVGTLDVLAFFQVGLQVHLEKGRAAGVVGAAHRPVVTATLVVPVHTQDVGVEPRPPQWSPREVNELSHPRGMKDQEVLTSGH